MTNQQPQSHPDVPHPRLHLPTNHSPLPSLCQPSPVSRLTSRLSSPAVIPKVKSSSRSVRFIFDSPIHQPPMEQKSHLSLRTSKALPPPPGSDNTAFQEKMPLIPMRLLRQNSWKPSVIPIRPQTPSLISNALIKANNHWNSILLRSLSSKLKPTSWRKAISSVDSSQDLTNACVIR